ncbi:MAG: DUF2357 domain-containing protein [Gemmatimonadetes bacterium]|nr:DUF2357 domain-containing protein [Gemmatimonadota bacterium]
MDSGQHIRASFSKTSDGLVAENDYARILLSPVQGQVFSDHLVEATECNCLIRPLNEKDISVYIDDQPVETLGFLRDGHALWGRLATGDHPGHIRFCIRSDNVDLLYAELDVRPSYLDYETDYQIMRADLERISRELVYLLPDQTRISTRLTDDKGNNLDFHQVLDRLLNQLVRTLHAILKRPHRHLKTVQRIRAVDRAQGRDPDAIVDMIRSPQFWTHSETDLPHLPIADDVVCTHLRETHRHSDIDTSLNRHLVARLKRLSLRARSIAHTDLGHRLKIYVDHCLRLLPLPPARRDDALPVHVDVRYQTAFALIRDLNCALAPCKGGPFDLSFRDTHALYEYWVYFTLVHTLCDIGFVPTRDDNLFHLTNRGLSVSPAQGEPSAIYLQRGEYRIRCLYNMTYTTSSGRALTHDLRPDMIIEINNSNACAGMSKSSRERAIYAFDAKYRREDYNGTWIPMREDIDKMHAYRDAIGQVIDTDFQRILKSAVVLFPAQVDSAYQTHAFYTSLSYGIGGLPLLPGDANTLSALKEYIKEHILS